jgi:6-phosphofructo-2-kinase/fructose-2,6-biphosphatase
MSLELAVSISTDPVSLFALVASWRALKKNLRPHASRRAIMGIPDVLLDHQIVPVQRQQHMHSDLQALELDLEHYEVPPPTSSLNSGALHYCRTSWCHQGAQTWNLLLLDLLENNQRVSQ